MRKRVRQLVLIAFSLGIGNAVAAPAPCGFPPRVSEVPTKKLRIYNNGESTLYAFLQSPERSGAAQDLWMQAVCGVNDWTGGSPWKTERTFQTTRNYRGYIETGFSDGGIPKNGWVEIVLPYYTQLKAVTADNLGKVPDQYIDWWEGGRTYLFDSAAAYNSALWSNDLGTSPANGGGLPQPVVNTVDGALTPTCIAYDSGNQVRACKISLKETKINPGSGIPFQLQELTFASPEGPPLNNGINNSYRTNTGLEWINYNVSSLDSVFLPVAMGPLDTLDAKNYPIEKWVGSDQSVKNFRSAISSFSDDGNGWPFFLPVYYDSKEHPGFPSSTSKACSVLEKFPTDYSFPAYKLPVIPGTFNVLIKSWVGASGSGADYPPTPPDISSNPSNWKTAYASHQCSPSPPPAFVSPPTLGDSGRQILALWRRCLNGGDTSITCKYVNETVNLFTKSYEKTCPGKNLPVKFSGEPNSPSEVVPWQLMTAVYGWVPVTYSSCSGFDLKLTAVDQHLDFKSLQQDYCKLQYNYLTQSDSYLFNPYTKFIHGKFNNSKKNPALGSTAYAFSIDDALAFIHRPSTGAIIAIGGVNGLKNKQGFKIPLNEQEALAHCRQD